MALRVTKFNVVMELVEPLLGTVPKQKEVYTAFIVSKAREQMEKDAKKEIPLADGTEATEESIASKLAEEPETIKEIEERGWTGFHEDEEGPFLYDYSLKGFLKESGRTMKEWSPDKESGEAEEEEEDSPKKGKKKISDRGTVKQLQDKISRYVFVHPRKIRLPKVSGSLERPLRCQTAQGPRVTVTKSDLVPTGTLLNFQIHVIHGGGITEDLLRDVLEYANYQGFGQWRGGGYGRAVLVSMTKVKQ